MGRRGRSEKFSMISGAIGLTCFIASVVWAIKGESFNAIAFLIASGIFWCSMHLSLVYSKLSDMIKLNKDKILAEKTLAAIMAQVKEEK